MWQAQLKLVLTAGLGVLVLSACERLGPPSGLGRPDLILEEAGDMGRYLVPGETPALAWKTNAKVYIFLSRNLKVRVTEAGSDPAELSLEERATAEQVLARHGQGQPIN